MHEGGKKVAIGESRDCDPTCTRALEINDEGGKGTRSKGATCRRISKRESAGHQSEPTSSEPLLRPRAKRHGCVYLYIYIHFYIIDFLGLIGKKKNEKLRVVFVSLSSVRFHRAPLCDRAPCYPRVLVITTSGDGDDDEDDG